MVPSLPYMQDTINLIKENPDNSGRFKVLVGGGPVSKAWAEEAGADAYGEDASDAVRQAITLLN